ncbi:MAG TPA: ATP-dependent DNA helicase RecQ [Gemmatimonadales bacterium]|nr:ATP-dependent DNA helicase RecQ [Gemmatimonadales bacterium]
MTQPTLDDARATLQSAFGYPDFRPGQSRAVTSVLEQRDTLVILPTGGGKSLCFQVPALLLDGLTIVVSPLISLMKDQVDTLVARGLPAAYINSTLSGAQVSDRLARAQRGELKMLYVAPERFDAGSTAERLRDMGVSLLAVDEAHCISEWGHDFRPSYLRMRSVRERLGNPPTIALTATATPEVREDIVRQLGLRSPETVITGFDRVNLRYYVVPAKNDAQKDASLVRALKERDGLAVVYASTRKAVERITGVLEAAGVSAAAYHAGLDDDHRHDVQDSFMNESVRAIVATNAFGMGIDKPNVRLVVHYTMPGTLEAYYQEAGRAGRDGLSSDCVLLHSYPDRFTHEFFIKGALPDRKLVENVYAKLQRVAGPDGTFTSSTADIARLVGGKTSAREVESVMRILVRAGAGSPETETPGRVFVRLLAAPARIRRELPDASSMERGLLRALWRVAGDALNSGAQIDLDGLPPGFGGSYGATPLLDWLQERQFIIWERGGGGACLTRPSAPLSAFNLDWESLDRRRRAEMSKLDAVQKYAYASGCRRAHVLRYFGDAAARSPCNGCDNCLGLKITPPGDSDRKPGRRTRSATGQRRSSGARASHTEAAVAVPVVDAADAPLFQALRTLRGEIARKEQVPAYVIFPDRSLAEMAVRRPRSVSALEDVHGVGPARLEKYGEKFIALIRSLPEPEVA